MRDLLSFVWRRCRSCFTKIQIRRFVLSSYLHPAAFARARELGAFWTARARIYASYITRGNAVPNYNPELVYWIAHWKRTQPHVSPSTNVRVIVISPRKGNRMLVHENGIFAQNDNNGYFENTFLRSCDMRIVIEYNYQISNHKCICLYGEVCIFYTQLNFIEVASVISWLFS